jgi:NTP pyrophosphatase (non-canonical NTP hydrolase)
MTIPSGLEIPDTSGLTALQDHVRRLCDHFQWTQVTERKFILLVEEIGELAKAVRYAENIRPESGKEIDAVHARANLQEEFADVLNYLLDLANGFDIDLGQAYADKMTRNFQRSWK